MSLYRYFRAMLRVFLLTSYHCSTIADEGYFELVKPPNPNEEMPVEGLEDAIAESMEDFMEHKEESN